MAPARSERVPATQVGAGDAQDIARVTAARRRGRPVSNSAPTPIASYQASRKARSFARSWRRLSRPTATLRALWTSASEGGSDNNASSCSVSRRSPCREREDFGFWVPHPERSGYPPGVGRSDFGLPSWQLGVLPIVNRLSMGRKGLPATERPHYSQCLANPGCAGRAGGVPLAENRFQHNEGRIVGIGEGWRRSCHQGITGNARKTLVSLLESSWHGCIAAPFGRGGRRAIEVCK